MNRRLAATLVLSLLTGCQALGSGGAGVPKIDRISVNGTSLAYVEQGSGETVVFVHGAFGEWRNWEGMRSSVASRYRFVALSLRYHHPNEWADDGRHYSLAQHVEDVAAFIRALDVGKVHLVGNSMGSRIVAHLAIKYPELVRSAVLGDPFVIAPTSIEGRAAVSSFQKDAAMSVAAARAGDPRMSAILLYNAVLDDAEAFENASAATKSRTLDNAKTMGPYSRQPPAAPVTCEQFKALPMPVLVVTGERSRAIFRYGSETMVGCLPMSVSTATIRGGRHDWFAKEPDAGAAAVLAFLEGK